MRVDHATVTPPLLKIFRVFLDKDTGFPYNNPRLYLRLMPKIKKELKSS